MEVVSLTITLFKFPKNICFQNNTYLQMGTHHDYQVVKHSTSKRFVSAITLSWGQGQRLQTSSEVIMSDIFIQNSSDALAPLSRCYQTQVLKKKEPLGLKKKSRNHARQGISFVSRSLLWAAYGTRWQTLFVGVSSPCFKFIALLHAQRGNVDIEQPSKITP